MARNVGIYIWWTLAIGIIVFLRIVFYLTTPLLDNDSIVVFMGAREWVATGVVSKVNTLAVLLTGILFNTFGENVLLSRLPQLLGGIGCMVLLIVTGKRAGNIAGPVAAVIFGSLPIAIFYSSIAKTYSLMVFLIFLGALFYDKSIRSGKLGLSILAGLSFICAFLCYTFAASAVFPIAIFFLLSFLTKNFRNHRMPALVTGGVFGILLCLIIAWRWNEFGFSVFNDYVTDWRFDLSTAIWHGRWVGLTDIWSVGIALLIPGLVILFHKPDAIKSLGPLASYGVLFCIVNLLLWLANPVNHFPRVLLPSLPFLALFLGAVINRLVNEKNHLGTVLAWFITSTLALGILYPRFRHGHLPLGPFDPGTGFGILLTVLAIVICFLFLLLIFYPFHKARQKRNYLIPLFIVVLAILTGPRLTMDSIYAQARIFQGRVELIDHAGVRNIMGGGDYQALASVGPDSVPRLLDLMPEELILVLDGKLLDVCKARGISHVIVSKDDPDGDLQMLAGLATQQGRDIRDIGRVYRALFDVHKATRIADNDYGALYVLTSQEPKPWTVEEKRRVAGYHPKFEFLPSTGMLWFSDEFFETAITKEKSAKAIGTYYHPDSESKDAKMVASVFSNDSAQEMTSIPVEPIKGISEAIVVDGFAGQQLLADIRLPNGKVHRQVSILVPEDIP